VKSSHANHWLGLEVPVTVIKTSTTVILQEYRPILQVNRGLSLYLYVHNLIEVSEPQKSSRLSHIKGKPI
jgi:hypothetical protein